MSKNIFLPILLATIMYGFWVSENFKEISAGVAIFLFGMLSLEQGFKAFSGGFLDTILQKSTDKLYKSISFGVLSTTIMQSSSLVSILTISFLSAGLIHLSQGIGIIFGANLGTTTGAWLIAGYGLKIDIASYAMPMLVFGIVFIFQKSSSLKGIGYILAGLGFLFLGIHYMKEGFEAFKNTIDLSAYAIEGYRGLFIFSLIGVFATVVMQSSHATLVLIITALSVGQISYENALALAIGANVGTTITAILGALSSNIEGKRLAIAHLIFNVVTGAIAITFIYTIADLVDYLAAYLTIADDNYTLKLALFHTIFNIIGIIVMIPFIDKLVLFLEKTIKTQSSINEIGYDSVKYLNDSVLEFHQSSLGAIIRETKHLYDNAFDIIAQGINLKKEKIISLMDVNEILKEQYIKKNISIEDLYNKKIKGIYSDIITFSAKAQSSMHPEDVETLYNLKLANREIVEAIKNTKHLQKNLIKFSMHPNKYIQKEYQLIKKSLVELLRDINIIATTDEEDVIVILLSKIRVNTHKDDLLANGTLDELIRNKHITNKMATSLMNDTVYLYNIRNNLCNMAEILFVKVSSELQEIQDEVQMTQSDIETILEQRK